MSKKCYKSQIKLHSFVNPPLNRGIFKEFISRARKLCSEKYLDEKLKFLIYMFVENGHRRHHLNSIFKDDEHQARETENTNSNIVKLP